MLFNSIEFLVFLPLVFLGYWFVFKPLKWQNLFIIAVSYLFYGWWDWRFLLLIALTSFCSYLSGLYLERYEGDRKRQKWISASNITLNLLILCLFKYFNFFSENLATLFQAFGLQLDFVTLNILLPVGISFYTFQALSYTIDVYQHKIKATHDPVAFFAFISFFPQLVAGPIERATNLLPQFSQPRRFDYDKAVDGMRQMLWGFFKKMVVADNCALFANGIFENYQTMSGSALFMGALFFTIQIYGDFSGYSDIAIGCARLFGINLMQNFNYPYFSRDIAEFWRRWHISLTTWFRDYIYIPLGGSRVGKWKGFRNTMIIFLVSGFWHGANWTFIAWGAYHAFLFLPLFLSGKNRKYRNTVAEGKLLPSFKEVLQMGTTFLLVVIGWVFFRAETITQTFGYLRGMCDRSLLTVPKMPGIGITQIQAAITLLFMSILIIIEWIHRNKQFGLQIVLYNNIVLRWSIYLVLCFLIHLYSENHSQFIYFQF
ncbi:MBOAT family O-acyltransferase [uncultured Parabacteroides sp.]|uniref:MBOAT family O-acyltransferase n=1 Tax=uncultured Parabacteroides sp. TaxID=512312 RepID=UPI0025E49F50|nr:MBOAT family O-acyltransferase [uncultured Parabacteroides sp.]